MKKERLLIIGFFLLTIVFLASCKPTPTKGGTILSLSKTDFVSNDKTINGQAWLLTIVQNGASQYVEGYFTPEDMKDLQDNTKTKKSLKVTLQNSPQICQYNIQQQNEYLYSINSFKIKASLKTSTFPYVRTEIKAAESACSDCYNQGGYYCAWNDEDGDAFNVYVDCFKTSKTATYGTIQFDKLKFESQIIATIDTQSFSGKVSNEGQQSVWLSDGIIQTSWSGSLVSGQDCPRAPEDDVISLRYNNQWIFTDENKWLDYKSYHFSGFTSCIDNSKLLEGSGQYGFDYCVNTYNQKVSNALIQKPFKAYGGKTAISKLLSDLNGQAVIQLGKDIQYPVITMRIKADTLGVVVPVGMPEIINSESSCFGTGDTGQLVIDVKNIGELDSTFISSANCQSPFKQSGTSIRTQVAKQSTQTIYIPITAETSQQEQKATCLITVQDLENPNNKDTINTETCVKGIKLCSANEERCVGERLEKCNAQGTSWVLIDAQSEACARNDCVTTPDCPSREGYSVECKSKKCVYTSTGLCKPVLKIGTAQIIPNLNGDCLKQNWLWLVSVIGGIITSLVLLLMLKKRFPKKNQSVPVVIISLLVGILSGVLIKLFWWLGIIVLLIIIVIKYAIPIKRAYKIYKR